MSSTHFDKVREFHQVFGLDIHSEPFESVFSSQPSLVRLRFDLIKEEILELHQAFRDENKLEIIDALTDILYVVYGAGVSFGIPMNKQFANLSQFSNINVKGDTLTNYERTKALYEEHNPFIPHAITTLFDVDNTQILQLMITNITNAMDLVSVAFASNNFEQVASSLVNTLYVTYLIGVKLGVDLNKSFQIVHSSNMSKVCRTEKEAQDTVAWYKNQTDSPYDSPEYRLSSDGKYFIVFNQSSGKILKSIHYTPANFESMLPE